MKTKDYHARLKQLFIFFADRWSISDSGIPHDDSDSIDMVKTGLGYHTRFTFNKDALVLLDYSPNIADSGIKNCSIAQPDFIYNSPDSGKWAVILHTNGTGDHLGIRTQLGRSVARGAIFYAYPLTKVAGIVDPVYVTFTSQPQMCHIMDGGEYTDDYIVI